MVPIPKTADGRKIEMSIVGKILSNRHWRIVGKYAARMLRERERRRGGGRSKGGDENLICTNDCALTCNPS